MFISYELSTDWSNVLLFKIDCLRIHRFTKTLSSTITITVDKFITKQLTMLPIHTSTAVATHILRLEIDEFIRVCDDFGKGNWRLASRTISKSVIMSHICINIAECRISNMISSKEIASTYTKPKSRCWGLEILRIYTKLRNCYSKWSTLTIATIK